MAAFDQFEAASILPQKVAEVALPQNLIRMDTDDCSVDVWGSLFSDKAKWHLWHLWPSFPHDLPYPHQVFMPLPV